MNLDKQFPVGMPVTWRIPSDFSLTNTKLQDWLLNVGSLTERLEALCEVFEVYIIGQDSAPLDETELALLGADDAVNWQVREVILYGDAVPWVYARSVIPKALCDAELANLGNKPLGKRIFNDPEFVRSEFEVGQLTHHPFDKENRQIDNLYARRSLFCNAAHKVLVAEAFLPECPCYL